MGRFTVAIVVGALFGMLVAVIAGSSMVGALVGGAVAALTLGMIRK